METKQFNSGKTLDTSFKSYYVVWKPNCYGTEKACNSRFKSYYVVWKLADECAFFGDDSLFKSYYVVWKLKYINKKIKMKYSLNRTM